MEDKHLRRRCEKIVRDLDIPVPFDMSELCRRLGERRGRPIHLNALSLPPDSPCGLIVSTERFDAIFFQADTGRLHQEHIIGHELGHLLSGHEAATVLDADVSRLLLPDMDPQVVHRVLKRTNYAGREEREAELIASLISRAAQSPVPVSTWVAPADVAGDFARLEDSLEHYRGGRGNR